MIRTSLAAAALIAALATITAPTAIADGGPYKNCSTAHADGRYDIPKGDPDYVPSQDRDGDGVACES